MWVYLWDSFLSIVQSKENPHFLLVRARHVGDIERVFHSAKVQLTRFYLETLSFHTYLPHKCIAFHTPVPLEKAIEYAMER